MLISRVFKFSGVITSNRKHNNALIVPWTHTSSLGTSSLGHLATIYKIYKKNLNEFFSQEHSLQKEQQIGVAFKVYEDVVARHASRGADSKLSNALDDGIFYHVFSQFSFVE